MENFKKATEQASKEAKWWRWAAWTLPFVALAILFFENLLGWETAYVKTLAFISITFFTISVYWWWWALSKIVQIIDGFKRTEQHFIDVKNELKETRKTIRGE